MPFFMTKKQRCLMRERRRKKKKFAQQSQDDDKIETCLTSKTSDSLSGKKRPRKQDTEKDVPDVNSIVEQNTQTKSNVVVFPSNLSPKQAKKFRKDARRRARAQGSDESKLRFITEGELEERPVKKRTRQFPRIKELVKEEKMQKEKEAQELAVKQSEDRLSEEYKARYIAMDCEMVGIGTEGRKSALARVSLTNWHGDIILDTFVQVPTRVTDFRTWVSGVKPKHIKGNNAMDVVKCRELVASIVKDKVVVGHALKNDFNALMISHPKQHVRDTAKYRRFQRYGGKKWRPRKLRDLVKENLDMVIQEEGQSHDSVDDARAAMELFKLAREEWEREIEAKARRRKK